MYGPQTIANNCKILTHLINYVSLQIAWIHAIAVFDGNLKIQKQITFVFMRVIKFFITFCTMMTLLQNIQGMDYQ